MTNLGGKTFFGQIKVGYNLFDIFRGVNIILDQFRWGTTFFDKFRGLKPFLVKFRWGTNFLTY